MDQTELNKLATHLAQLVDKLDAVLPSVPIGSTESPTGAYRWRRPLYRGYLEPIKLVNGTRLDDLLCIDEQKKRVVQNTEQFVSGNSANNVLLTGARGTGKSSLVKALLNEYRDRGLRVVEVEKHLLVDLPDIVTALQQFNGRFILYCDDLTFDENDQGYNALKGILDGSFTNRGEQVLVYATSNRRHLVPESMHDNELNAERGGEIHAHEAVDDKIALAERFGVWISLHPFNQDQFLEIVYHAVGQLGSKVADQRVFEIEALRWALARGSRSGRVAWQFARDWVGRQRSMVASS